MDSQFKIGKQRGKSKKNGTDNLVIGTVSFQIFKSINVVLAIFAFSIVKTVFMRNSFKSINQNFLQDSHVSFRNMNRL